MKPTKVLNLYAGVGGNRKLWKNVEVTAVENNSEIAAIYNDYFPDDNIIIADAHQYLLDHYKEFDFIWSSPPCPSHSVLRQMGVHRNLFKAVYPDFKLWKEILLLQYFGKGKWIVENVQPYYKPIIEPSFKIERHYFWSNFRVSINKKFKKRECSNLDKFTDNTINYGYNLRKYKIKNKRQILRNIVNPEVALHILNSAMKIKGAKFNGEQLNIFD